MTSVPYPSFITSRPVSEQSKALAAVGRCRITPQDDDELFAAIVAKNQQQANVNDSDEKEAKKLKKKYMKEGVALAKDYLENHLQLDASIIDIEMVLQPKDLITTDGYVAACFLDAGCQTIVCDGTNLIALDYARIPKERLMGDFFYSKIGLFETIDACQPYCGSISVTLTEPEDLNRGTMLSILESVANTGMETVIHCPTMTTTGNSSDADSVMTTATSTDRLIEFVSSVCKVGNNGKGTVALMDPTPEQLGLSYAACMKTDRPDGLYTTVVCTRNGEALGLVYSSRESIVAALESGRGVYYSRSRNELWRKGDSSGHYQILHRLDVDCDGDALRFTVTQHGEVAAFCHLNTLTCWGIPRGLRLLEETLEDRLRSAPEGSYTKRLFDDSELLRNKLVEEAQELSEANTNEEIAGELADLLYFAMVRAVKAGVSMDDAITELDKRARKVTRRQGDSKDFRIAVGNEILERKDATQAEHELV